MSAFAGYILSPQPYIYHKFVIIKHNERIMSRKPRLHCPHQLLQLVKLAPSIKISVIHSFIWYKVNIAFVVFLVDYFPHHAFELG